MWLDQTTESGEGARGPSVGTHIHAVIFIMYYYIFA
jgi:hypothetical protein